MTNNFRLRAFLVPLFFVEVWAPSVAAAPEPVLPLPAEKLLDILPSPPEAWSLKQSWAKNEFSDWLVTIAQRDYAGAIPTDADTGSPRPKARPTVRMRLIDSGYWPLYTTKFRRARPEDLDALHSQQLKRYPGTLRLGADAASRTVLALLIDGRFVLEVQAANLPLEDLERLVGGVDFAQLEAVPVGGKKELPRPMVLQHLDELRPEQNRTYRTFYTPPGEMIEGESADER